MAVAALALIALAAAPARLDSAPKFEAPKLEMKLPPLPKVESLSGPAPREALETRQAASDQRASERPAGAKVASIVHAREFARGAEGGFKPVSRFDALTVSGLPSRIAAFKTCVRLTSGDRLPVVVRAAVKAPSGEELLSSRAEVSFGSRGMMEVVIDWEGFTVSRTGDFKLAVSLDGAPSGEFPLPVQQAR